MSESVLCRSWACVRHWRITGPRTLLLTNLLVGDVWLCGGQSNMEFLLSRARNGGRGNHGRKSSRDPPVHGQVAASLCARRRGARRVESLHAENCDRGRWLLCRGLFFRAQNPGQNERPDRLDQGLSGRHARRVVDQPGSASQANNAWAAPNLYDAGWKTVTIPGGFRELDVPDAPSVCYFRKTVTLPEPLPAGSARILLGVVERMDTTQINGRWVGASAWVENPCA